MPFYLTNENIEATMERNPDDVFNPQDIENKVTSSNTTIMQLIIQVIKTTLEQEMRAAVITDELFNPTATFKEEISMVYKFVFETDNDEHEISYIIPSSFATVLKFYEEEKKIFLNLSNAIINALNEEDISYLQDINFIELSLQSIENEKVLNNMYVLNLSIDNKPYTLYLQLDNEFNKIF